uniref:Mitochondrial import inner membrane translocase subunit n=1 Tax=Aegilops tauschii TaxID=37682 RepID=M8C1Q6_AEGTA
MTNETPLQSHAPWIMSVERRIRLYAWLSHGCIFDCVTTFYRKTLGKREGDCVRACVRKYQLATAASAARFNKLADPSAAADDEDEDD